MTRPGLLPLTRWVFINSFGLGSMFVRKTFTGDSKQKADLMIEEVKTAFENNLPDLSWMDDQTRAAAIDKVGVNLLFGLGFYVC